MLTRSTSSLFASCVWCTRGVILHAPPAPPPRAAANALRRRCASTQGYSYGAMGRQTREGGSLQKPDRNLSNQPRKVPARGWHQRKRGSARRTRGAAARRRRYPIPLITPLLAMRFFISLDGKVSAPALELLSAAARVRGVSSTEHHAAAHVSHCAALSLRRAPPPPLQRPSSIVVALQHENARARARGGDGCGG